MNSERYKNYPNLFKVVQGMARCKNPDKVMSAMLLLLESGVKDSIDGGEDFGLSVGDVLSIPD